MAHRLLLSSVMQVRFWSLLLLSMLAACSEGNGARPKPPALEDAGIEPDAGPEVVCTAAAGETTSALRISELMSNNDGAWLDELGETDDFVELVNTGDTALELSDFAIRDENHVARGLPALTLAPGQQVLLWADEELEQGPMHLPFKLGADGDRVELLDAACRLVERVTLPALPLNESYARFAEADGFEVCPYASPGRANPARCEPPPPPELRDDETFEPFVFPEGYPHAASTLRINELALRPAAFVELLNAGDTAVDLATYSLRVAATAPGPLPTASEGVALTLPAATLSAGARMVVPVSELDVAMLVAPEFEGAVTLFEGDEVKDRVDFMRWPEDAVLARVPEDSAQLAYCTNQTRGTANTCTEVTERETGDRVRYLRVDGDFAKLAKGGTDVGLSGVKFMVDMKAGERDGVHILGSEKWALHYTFFREFYERAPALDRCDAAQSAEFRAAWGAFSEREYYKVAGRSVLLGTYVRHASGLHTIEFAAGDVISAQQMHRAFYAAIAHTDDPTSWALRPIDNAQLERMRELEGLLPIVGPNAPFVGVSYQPLTQTVGYGVLRFVRSDELETAELGPHVIVITDAVPNDVPFVGGLVTEAFQTPLAHVNVLSRARGTPNMALRNARKHPRIMPLLDKLVRLDVAADDFVVREATPEEADAFWQSREPTGPETVPPLDSSLRGVIPLQGRGVEDLPALGAKAAQFAELYRVSRARARCSGGSVPLNVPKNALAIPVAHYLEHFEASGGAQKLATLLADPTFRADPVAHARGLAELRGLITAHPLDAQLLRDVEAAVRAGFGSERVRFRSSSNTEDLPSFNGAGLHTSVSVELDDDELNTADGIRAVWASLWNTRAFDERAAAHVAQTGVAMGVLIHGAHRGEAAQGVAISRNFMHVTRAGTYYINAQAGEATVTNPAPGVGTEQLLYTFPPRTPELDVLSRSTLTSGEPVLDLVDARRVACAVGAVHDHFRPLLDPEGKNRIFAMQVEWKLMRETGELIVKQARPQPFAAGDIPADCREF